MRRVCFLDRDGVLNLDHGYVYRPDAFVWVPGALDALQALQKLGFRLVVVTNQSGLARGYYTLADFEALTAWMKDTLQKSGITLDGVYYCPHHPREGVVPAWVCECKCRKPKPGMLFQAKADLGLNFEEAVLVGDKASDMTAAWAAGIPTRLLVGTNGETLPSASEHATHVYRSLSDALMHQEEWL